MKKKKALRNGVMSDFVYTEKTVFYLFYKVKNLQIFFIKISW